MDELKVLILGVQKYQFTDEKTGREVAGCSVHYVQLTHSDDEDKIGYFPTKASLKSEQFNQFRGLTFPITGKASIQFDLSNKRNPIKVTGFTLEEAVIVQ